MQPEDLTTAALLARLTAALAEIGEPLPPGITEDVLNLVLTVEALAAVRSAPAGAVYVHLSEREPVAGPDDFGDYAAPFQDEDGAP